MTIAKNDALTILRVTIYAFNLFGTLIFVILVLILFPILTGGTMNAGTLRSFYGGDRVEFWVAILLFSVLFAGLTPIASSSFSREGNRNWIMRTLPISPSEHLLGRLLVPFISHVILVVLILVFELILIRQDYLVLILISILSILGSLPLLLLSLYIDLNRPVLK